MRTDLPPRKKSGSSFDHNGTPGDSHPGTVDYLELCMRQYPEARRRAVLSLIPGLGQIRNGELGKGLLFLVITLANLLLVAGVLMSGTVTQSLTGVANAMHRQPNFDLALPFHGVVQSPALFIYIALVFTFVWYAVRDAYDRAVRIIRDGYVPPKYALALPEAASGSYLGHFIVMTAMALLVVFFITPQPPKQQVTTIELVKPPEPEKPKPPAPRPKPPAPKPRVEPPKPVQKPVVRPQVVKKVEPPKPQPVAVAVPTNEPTPLTTAPVAADPAPAPAPAASEPAGNGGGTGTGTGGGGGGSGEDVDMGPWMRDLQRKIKKAWFPPKGNESKRIKVSFKVHKDGHVTKVKLISSSGVSIADDAAVQAISDAAPFAALPDGAGDEVDINFTFDYNVFGGRR